MNDGTRIGYQCRPDTFPFKESGFIFRNNVIFKSDIGEFTDEDATFLILKGYALGAEIVIWSNLSSESIESDAS
jgi:hypothetical protein